MGNCVNKDGAQVIDSTRSEQREHLEPKAPEEYQRPKEKSSVSSEPPSRKQTAETDVLSDAEDLLNGPGSEYFSAHNELSSPIQREQDAQSSSSPVPGPPDKVAFEFVSSLVTDGATGTALQDTSKVERGTTRCETLSFFAHRELHRLTRTTITSKKMGFRFVRVNTETLELGSFEASSQTPVQHELPPQTIPNSRLAKGDYSIHITYTAENVQDSILREETVEFTIV